MAEVNPSNFSDEEILSAFAQKEKRETAFRWLIQQYQKKIYYFIRRMVIDHDDANDLTQDVFIKVWENLHGFRGESKVQTWIYRIASNTSLNFLNSKHKKLSSSFENHSHYLSEKLIEGKLLNADEIQMKLQQAILLLPDRQRMVFNLRYYDEMEYSEMATMLNLSEGALKASYFHAVHKVEAWLKDHA